MARLAVFASSPRHVSQHDIARLCPAPGSRTSRLRKLPLPMAAATVSGAGRSEISVHRRGFAGRRRGCSFSRCCCRYSLGRLRRCQLGQELEHLGAANRTSTLCSSSAVLGGHDMRVLDHSPSLTFHAVGFDLVHSLSTPFVLIKADDLSAQ